MSPGPLRLLDAPDPGSVPADEAGLLRLLGGPAALRLPGVDRARCRVLVTLLHGNEPSGLRAVHAWLREGRTPATDVLVVLGGVDAALAPPCLTRRELPGGVDLNRCFGDAPAPGPAGELAHAILGLVRDARPEALVDVHNNTGHNPPTGSPRRSARPSASSSGSSPTAWSTTTCGSARSARRPRRSARPWSSRSAGWAIPPPTR
ncbi:MAG: hypothetical protein R3C15_10160 [Thermoleophilia bacterium]